VNVGAEEKGRDEIFNSQRQVTVSLIFCFMLVLGVLWAVKGSSALMRLRQVTPEAVAERQLSQDAALRKNATGTSRITTATERVGGVLYRYAALPFEIASILLLVAIIGSVMLARTLKQEVSADDVDPEVLEEEKAKDPELKMMEPQSQE